MGGRGLLLAVLSSCEEIRLLTPRLVLYLWKRCIVKHLPGLLMPDIFVHGAQSGPLESMLL